MKSAAKNIQLASYDDLFKTDEERLSDTQERVQSLPLDRLMPFPNHPFKVLDDEKMQETVESIKERGVLVPILVRPTNDGNFEIVSGHRRHHASLLAGKTEIPAIVREMDDDTAILLMVDSNLQREELLPSEKAFAYKMKLDAMKRQTGRKPKENDSRIGNHFDTRKSSDVLAEQTGDSKNQIFRYIRLTHLVPDLLDRVDNKTMAFNAAVEVSYLTESEQLIFSAEKADVLNGKRFAATGKLKTFTSRAELKEYLTTYGASLTETLSPTVDYLITNTPDSGTAKNKKAIELGIKRITEAQFNEMIGRIT